MVITIANQKGGSGKSTTAINLAVRFLEDCKDILVMDTDPQKNIETFTNAREQEENEKLNLKHFTLTNRAGNITESLKQSLEKYEHIIIDTGGIDSTETRKALLFADIVIIPAKPSVLDYDVLVKMLGLMREIKDINDKLECILVMNQVSPNPFLTKEIDDFYNAIVENNTALDFKLAKTILFDRISYKRAIGEGLGISEYTDTKAKDEFESFFKEVTEEVLEGA